MDKATLSSYTTRNLEVAIGTASEAFPVLLVTGARQVGKTTCLRRASASARTYVSLDDPLLVSLAREDPALFLQRFRPPLFIDEIQYAPQLLPYIKMAVDNNPQPGAYWLSGSQQFHLMQGITESLAGRVGLLRLVGLSRSELLGRNDPPFLPLDLSARQQQRTPYDMPELYKAIWRGSYPHLALHPKRQPALFYAAYLQTYLQRDVRDLTRVTDLNLFMRFLRAAAARIGSLLNLHDLARDTGISSATARAWLSVLEASDIVYLLPSWHSSVHQRFIKTPKLYFLDSGLCAYLTQWLTAETLATGAMCGAILENWLLMEILKSYWHQGREAPCFFYRDKEKNEVDLLILQDGVLYPIEFKRTASPSRHMARFVEPLQRLAQPIGPGALVCLSQQAAPLSANVQVVPVSWL